MTTLDSLSLSEHLPIFADAFNRRLSVIDAIYAIRHLTVETGLSAQALNFDLTQWRADPKLLPCYAELLTFLLNHVEIPPSAAPLFRSELDDDAFLVVSHGLLYMRSRSAFVCSPSDRTLILKCPDFFADLVSLPFSRLHDFFVLSSNQAEIISKDIPPTSLFSSPKHPCDFYQFIDLFVAKWYNFLGLPSSPPYTPIVVV